MDQLLTRLVERCFISVAEGGWDVGGKDAAQTVCGQFISFISYSKLCLGGGHPPKGVDTFADEATLEHVDLVYFNASLISPSIDCT